MFDQIRGDAGYVTAAGSRIAIIDRWKITRSGMRDGRPVLRFQAQFSWGSNALMAMKIKKSVYVQMKTIKGVETLAIPAWADWRFDPGPPPQITLEDVTTNQGA